MLQKYFDRIAEVAIEVTIPLSDIETVEHKTVTFECELNKPNKEVTWYKDGTALSVADAHYKITTEDFKYTLTVVDCNLDDGAEYTMKIGDVSTSAKLIVEGDSCNPLHLLGV